ncbi:MmgE/PrpD family protein [Robertmurraya kyonggiensis]|uniref:MmgE/PrpD family protein n=1 Tax=Robertmurraya kyonggiensis TaxID=1037680 RepID=A0A4U1DAA1_9BACI|nr:MmgE/PrpD family protein [Robertmurraya kyonggiensis]TKC19452.1 MmgE/PrpD family protein [Robertmurraya kyonggiensis]
MGLSKKLAEYITSVTYEELPKEVIAFTKLCILDYFGSAIAGADKPPIQMIHSLIQEMGGEEQATLLTGGRSSVLNASLVNGAASHIMELDDIHKGSVIHAATVVVPAALAIAEWKNCSGKDLITAVAVGYEICYRIGEAVTPSHYYYWHNTATCGTFGSAAAAAKLLELNEEQTIHALGSAGTQAAGLWQFIEDGAMSKQLHPGKAAMNGVISALLAEKGFTGATQILEGSRGFFRAMSEEFDESKITSGLGKVFKITENSFKVHASCRHTHPAMDLMIDLTKERTFQLEEIDHIKVGAYQAAINITDNAHPTTQYGSKFSLQFCTALALLKGKGGLDQFTEETLWDEEIRALMKKVTVGVDPVVEGVYPEKWGTKVELTLRSEEKLVLQTEYPKGDPENPVTSNELVDKFMILANRLPIENREFFANSILELDLIERINELFTGDKLSIV